MERKHIEVVLEQAMTLEEAAEMLGINVATLWRKRRRYGLD
jgi:NtrC-family two-component system response regulator AlgB